MYIVTSDKLINSDKIACFTVNSYRCLTERVNSMVHEVRAYCSAYEDEESADYFLIGRYGTEEEAREVFDDIISALQNGAAGLDLR